MSPFAMLQWRASIRVAPRVPTPYDMIEWATLLDSLGESDAAALLLDCALIRQGCSSQARALHAGRGMPTEGLAHAAAAARSTLDKALGELEALARDFAPRLGSPAIGMLSADHVGAAASTTIWAGDIRQLVATLVAALRDPRPSELGTMLTVLIEADRALHDFDYRIYAEAPIANLVDAIALAGMIFFARGTHDLYSEPLGSNAFLHRVAGLEADALGPYFTNVDHVARSSRDVFHLARAAAAATEGPADAGAWIALLSRACSRALRFEVVDDLGDFGAMDVLAAIAARAASGPRYAVDMEIVTRVRDAALDNGDFGLAARCQAFVVRVRPDDRLEREILGSIQASGGDFVAAEWTFRDCLRRSPGDEHFLTRLAAVRCRDFAGFTIEHGFGSPMDRRETRLRRRGLPPDYMRRAGERIFAVDIY